MFREARGLLTQRLGNATRFNYRSDTDSLYIDFRPGSSAYTVEIVDGFNADFDASGSIVGFDIDHVSGHVDVDELETQAPCLL